MNSDKIIKHIFPRPPYSNMVGDGFRVYNYFPSGYNIRNEVSPFLMLDFNPVFEFEPSEYQRGVDVHPHRGFETVTIAYKGSVAHHDSTGNSGVIHPGDVQWMTAASGILHKEYHEENFSRRGGEFQMVQLWVNLPKQYKMSPPKYQALTHDHMGKVELANGGGTVNVIAGDYQGVKGPASTFTPIHLYDIRMNAGGTMTVELPATYNTSLLIIEGGAKVNGEETYLHDFVLFDKQGESIRIEATEDSILLLLSGEPINEPIAQYGPFVMNTTQELQEAMEDFKKGKFGQLD